MDRRSQFYFRSHDFVRGRPVARYNTARFQFGENRPSRCGQIHLGGARPGIDFKPFRPVGYFGAPFRCMRMAMVYHVLPALVMALGLLIACGRPLPAAVGHARDARDTVPVAAGRSNVVVPGFAVVDAPV